MKFFLFALLFFPFFSHAEENIIVELATENRIALLYIAPFDQQESVLNQNYINQLENVLHFDWSHNGSTKVVKGIEDKISRLPLDQFGPKEAWQAHHIRYIIKGRVSGQNLQLALLDSSAGSIKISEPKSLSGDLGQDRKIIHQLSDSFFKAVFNQEGIASTHLLYTVKTPIRREGQKLAAEVWESDYDGANARQITNDQSFCVTPAYIPPQPGYKTGGFLYVSYQLGQPKIYGGLLRSGVTRRVMPLKASQMMPAVSRQRDRIAFISDITGNPDLFIQPFTPDKGAIGKPEQVFSARQATQSSPAFSHDGKQVAFVSDKDGAPKIYVIAIPPAGSSLKNIKATLISKRNRENSAPSWSPDGKKLAYCARSGGERQIWVYDFETGEEKQLTQGPGHKENPSWAPNSLHLVYNTADLNDAELYMINLNQTDPVKITSGPGEKRFPDWEPIYFK